MTRKNFFSIQLWGAAIVLNTTVFSCSNNDTTDRPATTADTATVATSTPPVTATDTSTIKATDKMAESDTGMAKPNPAKKGLKGKVTILPPPAATAEVKMEADNTGVYANTEILPSYPGGQKALQKFFDRTLVYPEEAGSNGVEGTVQLSFVVDETGKLTNPEVMGKRVGYGTEAEALRVVSKMPPWTPGQLKGKNVKTRFTLPVKFVLE